MLPTQVAMTLPMQVVSLVTLPTHYIVCRYCNTEDKCKIKILIIWKYNNQARIECYVVEDNLVHLEIFCIDSKQHKYYVIYVFMNFEIDISFRQDQYNQIKAMNVFYSPINLHPHLNILQNNGTNKLIQTFHLSSWPDTGPFSQRPVLSGQASVNLTYHIP